MVDKKISSKSSKTTICCPHCNKELDIEIDTFYTLKKVNEELSHKAIIELENENTLLRNKLNEVKVKHGNRLF